MSSGTTGEGLPYVDGGVVLVDTPEALDKVLGHCGQDLSSLLIDFEARGWRTMDYAARAMTCEFLGEAVDRVCAAGLLPRPDTPLPPCGTRVEAMVVGGKPGPRSKYGTGTVKGHSWDGVFYTWRVEVGFDQPAGSYYGSPIWGASTFPNLVHVIGSRDRPFSTMTPAEVEALHEERRLEFWRRPGPAAYLEERQEFWRTVEQSRRAATPSRDGSKHS